MEIFCLPLEKNKTDIQQEKPKKKTPKIFQNTFNKTYCVCTVYRYIEQKNNHTTVSYGTSCFEYFNIISNLILF